MPKNLHYLAIITLFATLLLIQAGCQSKKEKADCILHHGVIYTVDSAFSIQEAMAIKDGKILAVGSNQEILDAFEADSVGDLKGLPVYPGFYDAHAHFFGLAEGFQSADLVGVASEDELLERLLTFRKEHPDAPWILGHGWDQNRWPEKHFPNKKILDAHFPDIPVYVTRIDYHAAFVNSKALDLSGIRQKKSVDGGLIEGISGEPTGILLDNAMELVARNIASPDKQAMEKLLKQAEAACFSVGLTTIADAGLAQDQIELLEQLYDRNVLKIRDYAMVMLSEESLKSYLQKGISMSDRLDVRSFKIVGDGALGSRGACLLHPYSDAPDQTGFLLLQPELLEQVVKMVAESPFQLNVHAIGDSTNREILDLFGKYIGQDEGRRWRIEHAQIVNEQDFDKFGKYHIIPSIQPTHATSDMFWAKDRIGEDRLKNAYAYQRLLEQRGLVALGSDFPVEHYNPLYGFHAAVARVNADSQPTGGFQMSDALSRENALRGMTTWAAYACFQEDNRGSLEPGKFADIVVLEEDIMKIPENKLRQTKVASTMVNGEIVFGALKGQ